MIYTPTAYEMPNGSWAAAYWAVTEARRLAIEEGALPASFDSIEKVPVKWALADAIDLLNKEAETFRRDRDVNYVLLSVQPGAAARALSMLVDGMRELDYCRPEWEDVLHQLDGLADMDECGHTVPFMGVTMFFPTYPASHARWRWEEGRELRTFYSAPYVWRCYFDPALVDTTTSLFIDDETGAYLAYEDDYRMDYWR